MVRIALGIMFMSHPSVSQSALFFASTLLLKFHPFVGNIKATKCLDACASITSKFLFQYFPKNFGTFVPSEL